MDPSQYKDYVLILLFVKYVSDKYANVPNALLTIPEGCKKACKTFQSPGEKSVEKFPPQVVQ
jgi:type I restriction-modification system DNA methylase subunit